MCYGRLTLFFTKNISYLQQMKTYVAEYIEKIQEMNMKDKKINVLLTDLIHNDTKMFDFLQSQIFNCKQESQIHAWLEHYCNIDYYGRSKKRELILQIREHGDQFVSNIDIEKYPYKNKLNDMVILDSITKYNTNAAVNESHINSNNNNQQ